jgi:ribosomal protein S18 acetylase RimI-like enzyme
VDTSCPSRTGHAHRVLDALLGPELDAVLHVNIANAEARRFYEHYGFRATGLVEPLRPGSQHLIELMVLHHQ